MNRIHEATEQYLGYQIRARGDVGLEACAVAVRVTSPDGQLACTFVERLDGVLQRALPEWSDDDEQAVKQLGERAFHRARGAILLDRLDELKDSGFSVPQEPGYAERSEEYLRALILTAFKRAYRHAPWQGGRVAFDDIGVALMEDLRPSDVEYTLARLQGDGKIKSFATGHEPGARLYMPTAAGLAEADRLPVPSRAPGLLVEETVARVETTLNKYKPELVEQLRRQSLRVAEARQLSQHEVGEVAQACEQMIWDFLDLDALWEGIPGKRLPRDKTRDRVRLLLKARAPSDTETSLLDALDQYLVGWFGPLQEFVHKHRHLPGESERRHAKRLVTYTYLLLADLTELIGL
jgi:hypothetical protein